MAEPVGQRLGLLPVLLVPPQLISHRTKCAPPPKWSSRALVHQPSTPVPNLRASGWGLGQKTQLPLSLFRSEKLKRQFLPRLHLFPVPQQTSSHLMTQPKILRFLPDPKGLTLPNYGAGLTINRMSSRN